MNPIKLDLIQRKISIIRQELGLLKKLQKKKITSKSDLMVKHALCHALQNCIAAVIDISQHIVAEKTDNIPESYADSILKLGELKILSKKFAEEFSKVAKLRNVLVHLYDDLNIEFLWSLIPKLTADLKIFMAEVRRKTG